mmetsp:Transcript_11746/g.29971  ORF Transcript_11746/g.29971 Transcript_11746/m.29971 type:complete len:212 (-) Transcript_11746:51-686(-)
MATVKLCWQSSIESLGIFPASTNLCVLVDIRHCLMVSNAKNGQTALTPYPTRHAKWCVEKHCAVSVTIDASVLKPQAMRWWWTAPAAKSIGIAGFSASSLPSGLSVKTIIWQPSRTALSTSLQSLERVFDMLPRASKETWNFLGFREFSFIRRSSPSSVSTGDDSETCLTLSFDGSSRLPRRPILTSRLITRPSLNGSIAGFVTCANLCLK